MMMTPKHVPAVSADELAAAAERFPARSPSSDDDRHYQAPAGEEDQARDDEQDQADARCRGREATARPRAPRAAAATRWNARRSRRSAGRRERRHGLDERALQPEEPTSDDEHADERAEPAGCPVGSSVDEQIARRRSARSE